MTQRQLAAKLDIDFMAVSRWERGTQRPNDANLQALADAFKRPVSWFFEPAKAAA